MELTLPIELIELFNKELNNNKKNNNEIDQSKLIESIKLLLPIYLLLQFTTNNNNNKEDNKEDNNRIELVNKLILNALINSKKAIKLPEGFNINKFLEELYSIHLSKLESILTPSLNSSSPSTLLNHLESQKTLELNLQFELNTIKSSTLLHHSHLTNFPLTLPSPPPLESLQTKINLLISTLEAAEAKMDLLIYSLEFHPCSLTSTAGKSIGTLLELGGLEKKKLEKEIKGFKSEIEKYQRLCSTEGGGGGKEEEEEDDDHSKSGKVRGKTSKSEDVRRKAGVTTQKSDYELIVESYKALEVEESELRADLERLGWKEKERK